MAVRSDVHGNLTALGAVLADLDARGVHGTYLEGVLDNAEPAPFGIQFVRVPFDTEQEIAVAEAKAKEVATGLYAILSYPVSISGGTGRFSGASGTVWNIGAVDLNTQRTIFRYQGDVCFKMP